MTDGRGGKRPGAGRKPLADPRKRRGFKATDSEWESITQLAAQYKISANEFLIRRALETTIYFTDTEHKQLYRKLIVNYPDRGDCCALVYILTSKWLREVMIFNKNNMDWDMMDERARQLDIQHIQLYEFAKNLFGLSSGFNFSQAIFIWSADVWPVAHQAMIIYRNELA